MTQLVTIFYQTFKINTEKEKNYWAWHATQICSIIVLVMSKQKFTYLPIVCTLLLKQIPEQRN